MISASAFARGFGRTGSCAALLWALATPAFAQEAPQLRDNRVTINAGLVWLGGYDVGTSTAQLRGNGSGLTPPPFTLFTAESRFATTTAPELRVGVSLTPRLAIEGGVSLSYPRIAVSISSDPETSVQELPGEELQQYIFDGGLSWQLPINLGRKLAPFVVGGAGYLRQLHEDRTLAETGRIYYAGGGARYWLRGGHDNSRPIGVRGDFRINLRSNGIDFEDKMRTYPTISVFVFVGI
jgi:hypothetical protein